MRRRTSFLLAALLLASLQVCYAQTTYSRQSDLDPLTYSHDELIAILSRAGTIAAQLNSAFTTNVAKVSAILGTGQTELALTGPLSPAAVANAPAIVYTFEYQFVQPGAPVSLISLQCGDVNRRLQVKGASQAAVDTLYVVLADDLAAHAHRSGGVAFRTLAGVFLVIVGLAVAASTILLPKDRLAAKAVGTAIGYGLVISVWLLPFERWFPGTAVSAANASFVARYSAQIGFAGLVSTIVLGVLGLIVATRKSPRKAAELAPRPSPPERPRTRRTGHRPTPAVQGTLDHASGDGTPNGEPPDNS